MITSFDARAGKQVATVAETDVGEVSLIVERAAAVAESVASTAPHVRRQWLTAVADALDCRQDELARLADLETGLGLDRLRAEIARTAGQLRFYAEVAVEGSFLGVTIDDLETGARLVRVNQPLGPVAVFGASNFPFAFSVLGNDTGAALAAGCPVIVKGHPAHPQLSERLAELATTALRAAGAPDGTFGLVHGQQAGVELVEAPEIQAVAFTGSQSGGLALWRLANERERVIPVFAEMGTVNPVVVTEAAAEAEARGIAEGFVGSFTLGSGQFCTKPGVLFGPAGHAMAQLVAQACERLDPDPVMLTEGIADNVERGVSELLEAGAEVVTRVGGAGDGWTAPAVVLRAPIAAVRPGSRLLDEVFGAVAVVVEYAGPAELHEALDGMQPSLAASVFGHGADDRHASELVKLLSGKVGRVAVNEWPTGVAYAWAQQHGGPWPATSSPAFTSVGAAALGRFVRPVAYQSTPDSWLPPAAQEANPWSTPRRVNGVMVNARE